MRERCGGLVRKHTELNKTENLVQNFGDLEHCGCHSPPSGPAPEGAKSARPEAMEENAGDQAERGENGLWSGEAVHRFVLQEPRDHWPKEGNMKNRVNL